MSGTIDFLLDTNYILALIKGDPNLAMDRDRLASMVNVYAVSVITRIELLGFPDITSEEEREIQRFFAHVYRIPLTQSIEDRTIRLRRERKMKVPDAIIVATALEHGPELLTLDERLRAAFVELREAKKS